MTYRQFLQYGVLCFFALFVAGCSDSGPVLVTGTIKPAETGTPIHTLLPASKTPPATLTPLASPSALPEATATRLVPSPLPFQLCSPLERETIPELFEIVSDPYKPPPPQRAEERHHGVDFSHYSREGFSSIEGEAVQAILPGVVVASVSDRLPYGNMLIVETKVSHLPGAITRAVGLSPDRSLYVLYAHFRQAPLVTLGDPVVCGQKVGEVGAVGYNVVNAHLHLETRIGPPGESFTSMAFYTTTASVEEMENYQRWRTGGDFEHFDPMDLFQSYLDWYEQK